MTRPRIGITTTARDPSDGKVRMTGDYFDAVRRAGGLALLLPPGEMSAAEVLEACDGFVLTGGGDIDPALYGGRAHPEIYGVDRERDDSEIQLVRALVAQRVPTLCICRGLQVLNVALGGQLIEDIPDEIGTRVIHRGGGVYQEHRVQVEPDSRLARALGVTHCSPPSWHHQAARAPAPPLRVVARADDGVIEGLEHPDHEKLWAVQWHPEHTAARDAVQQKLFDVLVRAAR